MKILLRSDVDGVGKKGDIVEVSDGHARNFLLPKGFAERATGGAERQAVSMRRARGARDAADRASAEDTMKKLGDTIVTLSAKAGTEGRLFGSVTTTDIAEALLAQTGIELDRRLLELPTPIKALGQHSAIAHLHGDVHCQFTIDVAAE